MSEVSGFRIDPLINGAFLAGRGHSAQEIAALVSCDPDSLRAALRLYNIRLEAKPFGLRTVHTRLTPAIVKQLEALADQRETDVAGLVQGLVSIAVRDRLIDGILDDKG